MKRDNTELHINTNTNTNTNTHAHTHTHTHTHTQTHPHTHTHTNKYTHTHTHFFPGQRLRMGESVKAENKARGRNTTQNLDSTGADDASKKIKEEGNMRGKEGNQKDSIFGTLTNIHGKTWCI